MDPIARHYASCCREDPDDLLQVGRLGLVTAALRFNPRHGVAFRSFARPMIRGEILHHLRDHLHPVRPPRGLVELRDRVVRCQWRYRKKHGREPSFRVLQQELGVDAMALEEATGLCRRRPLSLADKRVEPQCSRAVPAEDAVWIDQCAMLVHLGLAELEQEARSLLVAVHYQKRSLRGLARDAATHPMCIQRKVKRAEAQLRRILEIKGLRGEQLT